MVPTEERNQSVDFSKIYHKGDQGVLIRANDKDSIKTIEALKGKKIGVQKGSLQVKLAKEQIESPNLKELGKVSDLVLSLKTNKVDAVLCGVEVAKAYVSKNPDIYLAEIAIKSNNDGTAVAMKKESTALAQEVNKTVDRLIQNKMIERFISEAQVMAEQ